MPENIEVVESFQRIKSEANCDDLAAAILTLAHTLSWLNVNLQVSDTGYPERVGGTIADAIESVSKHGAIQLSLNGEMMNNVRALVDVSDGATRSSERKQPARTKKKK